MNTREILIVLLTAAAGLAAVSSAQAAGGCGIGYHRAFGRCFRNGTAPVLVARPALEIVKCPLGYHLGPHGQRCFRN